MSCLKLALLIALAGSIVGCGQKPNGSNAKANGFQPGAKPEELVLDQDFGHSESEPDIKPESEVDRELGGSANEPQSTGAIFPAKPSGEVSFVSQKLAPFTAEVLMPKDWFYREDHRRPSYTWYFSKEDTKDGTRRYETGVQIQAFFGVKENTRKSPEGFVADFVETRCTTEGVKTLQISEEQTVGPFKLITLATEEGGDRIVHTCYWGDGEEFDVVAVILRGTKKELWDMHRPVFDQLTVFDLRLLVGGARSK